LARCIGEEVELDGAAGLGCAHRVIVALAGAGLVRRRGYLEVPGSSIHVGLLTLNNLISTPMKTRTQMLRKKTGESIPSFKPTRLRRAAYLGVGPEL
ncbi:MAG: hypothetical protein WBA58_05540, partial [Giesbergeria sp.]